VARPGTDTGLPHIGLAGGTYPVLLKGSDTAGRSVARCTARAELAACVTFIRAGFVP
jgi:hypothetical protein